MEGLYVTIFKKQNLNVDRILLSICMLAEIFCHVRVHLINRDLHTRIIYTTNVMFKSYFINKILSVHYIFINNIIVSFQAFIREFIIMQIVIKIRCAYVFTEDLISKLLITDDDNRIPRESKAVEIREK